MEVVNIMDLKMRKTETVTSNRIDHIPKKTGYKKLQITNNSAIINANQDIFSIHPNKNQIIRTKFERLKSNGLMYSHISIIR